MAVRVARPKSSKGVLRTISTPFEDLGRATQAPVRLGSSRKFWKIFARSGTTRKRARQRRDSDMATAQLGTVLRHIHRLAGEPPGSTRRLTDRQLLDDFATRRDEAAFAALVARHGPMVLRVCRRVLNHEQDAEDAFQATFLVLARHIHSIRKREALANWLYGVAYRTAMNAKRSAARRRNHEARLRERTPPLAPGPTWDDVQAVLGEEP